MTDAESSTKRPKHEHTTEQLYSGGQTAAAATLPYDILDDIFKRVLFAFGDTCESHQDELANLSFVCKHWRKVALNIPRLWSTLVSDILGQKTEEEEIIRRCKLWFSRAQDLPLSVEIFMQGWNVDSQAESGFSMVVPSGLWKYLSKVAQLHSLRLCGQELLSIFELFEHPWQSLKHLVIDISKRSINGNSDGPPFQDYDNIGATTASCMWAARVTRTSDLASRRNNLTSLTIHAYVSSFFILSLLEESPLLETLDLDLHPKGYRTRQDAEAEEHMTWKKLRGQDKVVLSNVRDLKLSNVTRREELLQYLRIPQCQQLRLCDPSAHILALLVECLEGSCNTMKQLQLERLDIDDLQLLDFLHYSPSIHSLTLHRLEFVGGSFLRDLMDYKNCAIAPRLRSINIAGNWKNFDTETLLDFIRARGRGLRGKSAAQGGGFVYVNGPLEWALFKDWLYPELFVRYDANDRSVKLLRTVMEDRAWADGFR